MTIPLHDYVGGPTDGELAELMSKHARIAITGGPRTGKTTLAARIDDRLMVSTDGDAYRALPYVEVPAAVIETLKGMPRFVVEGHHVARALRKGLAVDCVIYLRTPLAEVTPRQASTAKGVRTVLDDCLSTGAYVPEFHESEQ